MAKKEEALSAKASQWSSQSEKGEHVLQSETAMRVLNL